MESTSTWWAYIHTEDRSVIRIKRIIPNPGLFTGDYSLNDLEYAIKEKDEGNDNIYIIIPIILQAKAEWVARNLARDWLMAHGYTYEEDGWHIPPMIGIDRFARIDIE